MPGLIQYKFNWLLGGGDGSLGGIGRQGAARGYNPSRHGRASHHPLLAFVAEARMVANFCCGRVMRTVRTTSCNLFVQGQKPDCWLLQRAQLRMWTASVIEQFYETQIIMLVQ